MNSKKVVRGYIVDIAGIRQHKVSFEKNGYEQDIWVNLNEYIGYRVKMLQKTKKISNKQLSEKAGFSNNTIVSRIKSGKHSYQIDTIYKLCVGLDCKSLDILPF
jgi:DNA-binding Xre family transcriptional regulator